MYDVMVSLISGWSDPLIDMSIYLLNIDTIQGLDLLSSGGGFGFVVSISLKDKWQKRHHHSHYSVSVDSIPLLLYEQQCVLYEAAMAEASGLTSSPNVGEGPQPIVLSSAAIMVLLFLLNSNTLSQTLHREKTLLHINVELQMGMGKLVITSQPHKHLKY